MVQHRVSYLIVECFIQRQIWLEEVSSIWSKKLGFPVCLHYSLINRPSHWILVSMFSCEFDINTSRFFLCVRVNRYSGSGESAG